MSDVEIGNLLERLEAAPDRDKVNRALVEIRRKFHRIT
jgi:hypothetical protein